MRLLTSIRCSVLALAVVLWAIPASAQQEVDASAIYLGVTGSVCKGTAGSAPSGPSTCDFYINTTTGVWYARWSTGAWVQMGHVPAALTKTDDTNVTLTLGGTPSTALLQAVSLTLGWSGQLAASRGGTGLSAACASAGQFLRSTGSVWGCSTPTLPNAAASASYLRGDGTNWIESTLKLPNSSTAYRALFSSTTNTVSDATTGALVNSDAGFSAKALGVSRYGVHLYADPFGNARLDATDSTGHVWIPLELRASVVNVRGNQTVYGDSTVAGNLLPDAANTRSIGSITKPWLTIDVSEFRARTIVAQDVMSTIGGVLNILPTSVLTADVGTGDLSITVKHNLFSTGDVVWLQKFGQFEAMRIAGSATGTTGLYIYLVDRNLDASGANAWVTGDGVQNTGTTGDGMIECYATSGVTSGTVGPTCIGNVRTGTAYNAMSPRWAIGNLNGVYGYSTDTYGTAFGDASAAWVKIDPTNGIRMGHNSTTKVQIDASGNASFSGTVTAGAGAIGGWAVGATTLTGGNAVLTNTGNAAFGTSNDIVRLSADDSTCRLWIGNASCASAPFFVTKAGAATMTGATITGPNITLGHSTSSYDANGALKFTRDGTFSSDAIYGVHAESSGGTFQTLSLQNYAKRTGVADAKADTILSATGWKISGDTAASTASVRAYSDPTESFVTIDADKTNIKGAVTMEVISAAVTCDASTNNNDINIGTAAVVQLTSAGSSSCIVTGFTGGVDGRVVWVLAPTNNTSNTTFWSDATGSSSGNQIRSTPGSTKFSDSGTGAMFVYYASDSKWVLIER